MNTFYNKQIDLKILKVLKKKIIMVTNGSDTRPPFLSSAFDYENKVDIKKIAEISAKKKRKIQRIEKYADIIVSEYSRSQFLEKPFVERSFLGRPIRYVNAKNLKENELKQNRKAYKIIHAPSARNLKGTKEIIKAVENLKSEGLKILFDIIENKSNKEVLIEIASCDLVVDQLYSDILMPGLAAEAGIFKKPVIVGGYDLEKIKELLPSELIPPTYTCKPENLEETIRYFYFNQNYGEEIGSKLNDFIQLYSGVKNVAINYQKLIEDRIPKNWYMNPKKLEFINGVGIDKNNLKKQLFVFIQQNGVDALRLDDKKHLVERIVNFCKYEK